MKRMKERAKRELRLEIASLSFEGVNAPQRQFVQIQGDRITSRCLNMIDVLICKLLVFGVTDSRYSLPQGSRDGSCGRSKVQVSRRSPYLRIYQVDAQFLADRHSEAL